MDGSQFSIQLKCLYLVGFSRDLLPKFPKILRGLQLFYILCIVLCIPPEATFAVVNFNDVLVAAESGGPLFTEIMTLTKMVSFFVVQKRFFRLVDQIQELTSESNSADSLTLRKVNQFDKNVTMLYLITAITTGVGMILLPIAMNIVNVCYYGKSFKYEMPMRTLFPFDINYSPVFELTYLLYCGGTFITVFTAVGVDSLFFGVCLNICAHLDILKDSFDGDKPKFVKRHQKIMELAENLKQLVKPIVFVQFLVSSIVLCVLGFQIVALDSIAKRVISASFGLAITMQLFVYSYGGQLIMEKSSSVADLFYQNDKDFVIIIARAQKATVIEAGFYKATLSTFRAILSSTASLITLLQSFLP